MWLAGTEIENLGWWQQWGSYLHKDIQVCRVGSGAEERSKSGSHVCESFRFISAHVEYDTDKSLLPSL